MYQGSLHWEGLAKEVDVFLCVGEPDERDAALSPREVLSVQAEASRHAPAAVGAVHLPGAALSQCGIAMLGVMEGLEARQLCRQMGPIAEGLAPPEELVIDETITRSSRQMSFNPVLARQAPRISRSMHEGRIHP
jgi:hypothetical protein